MDGSFQLSSDGIYRCAGFQQFVWQAHGFGTRAANPAADVTLRQIHSDVAINAHGVEDRQYQGDALITNDLNKTIGIRTADCVPILLLDAKQKAVAAVHAGWRGTAEEVLRCTLLRMQDDFGTEAADVYAAIGPCIRGCCYEVGQEVAECFASTFPEWGPLTGKRKLDLAEANSRQLVAAGLKAEHVFDSKLCTACQLSTFFSYRREPENPGRMLSVIARLC